MADRAARLKALRAKAGKSAAPASGAPVEAPTGVKFRNYVAKDESLDASAAPETEEEEEEPVDKKQKTEEKSAVALALEAARAAAPASGDTDVPALAPKKPNWDLKRDVAASLEKLEKRTQKNIISLLKERLEKEAADEDSDLD